MRLSLAALAVLALSGTAWAQHGESLSDANYLKRAKAAAPAKVINGATIIRMQKDGVKTLKQGDNGWTCMIASDVPMCMDKNAMEWAKAWQEHGPPTDKTGFIYMLAGDTGASNTDPWATAPAPGNHWIKTGSHVMIVGAGAVAMGAGYPRSADPDPTKPYVMWPGSPYEHLMLPVK